MHRAGKEGLGAAYLAGFRWALDRGYDAVVEMDADGSHRPEHLPAPARRGRRRGCRHRLALGARRVGRQLAPAPQGALGGRQPLRQRLLGMRGQRRHRGLPRLPAGRPGAMGLDDVASQGYCFQIDLTWRAVQAGLRVVEVPITFVEREVGESKMSRDIMTESLRRITGWGVRHRVHQVRGARDPRAEVARAVSRSGATPYRRRGACAGGAPLGLPRPARGADRRDRGDHRRSGGSSADGRPCCCWWWSRHWVRGSSSARVADLAGPAGGAAQRPDAEPPARRRRARPHRRHPAADARVRHRHRRVLLHPAADPPGHPRLARGPRRPAASSGRWGVGPVPVPGGLPAAAPDGRTSSRARSSRAASWTRTSPDPRRTTMPGAPCGDTRHPMGRVRRTCACAAARRGTRAGASGAPRGAPRARGSSGARAACPSGCVRA